MALIYTPQAEFHSPCPDFRLPAVDGKQYSLDSFSSSQVLVVMFICNHCPYVQAVEQRLIDLANELKHRPVQLVGICSNDSTEYPQDSFENLKARWIEKKYSFPYLHDESQQVAKDFGAVCTPDFFVFDSDRTLSYRGRLDDSWNDATMVRSQDLRAAIISLLDGRRPVGPQEPSMGCSIKWIKRSE